MTSCHLYHRLSTGFALCFILFEGLWPKLDFKYTHAGAHALPGYCSCAGLLRVGAGPGGGTTHGWASRQILVSSHRSNQDDVSFVSFMPELDLDEPVLVLVLVLGDCGRVLAQEEGGEGEVAAQPDAAQVAHGVAHPQDGQAQRHEDAAQHEDGEHEQRLRIIRSCQKLSSLLEQPACPSVGAVELCNSQRRQPSLPQWKDSPL